MPNQLEDSNSTRERLAPPVKAMENVSWFQQETHCLHSSSIGKNWLSNRNQIFIVFFLVFVVLINNLHTMYIRYIVYTYSHSLWIFRWWTCPLRGLQEWPPGSRNSWISLGYKHPSSTKENIKAQIAFRKRLKKLGLTFEQQPKHFESLQTPRCNGGSRVPL